MCWAHTSVPAGLHLVPREPPWRFALKRLGLRLSSVQVQGECLQLLVTLFIIIIIIKRRSGIYPIPPMVIDRDYNLHYSNLLSVQLGAWQQEQ